MTIEEKLVKIATRPRPGVRLTRKQIAQYLESKGCNVSISTYDCDYGLKQWTETDITADGRKIYGTDNARTAAGTALEIANVPVN